MDFIANLLGPWSAGFNVPAAVFRVFFATLLALVAGTERSTKFHSAGIRTFICVSLVAVLGALGDMYLLRELSVPIPLLCPAVIIGIAVISSSTLLYSSKNQLRGLTTSVGLGCVGIISVLIGYGLYTVGAVAFLLFLLVLTFLPRFEKHMKRQSVYLEAHIELRSREGLGIFIHSLRQFGLKINDIEANPAYVNSGLGVYSLSMRVVDPVLRKKSHREIIEAISAMETVAYIEEIF